MSESTNNENVLLIAEDTQEIVKDQEGEQATEAVLTTGTETATEAEPTALDNALTIGIVAAMVVAIVAMVIRKLIADKKPAPAPVVVEEAAPVADAPKAPGTAGEVKLHNVEPKTAAMLMAIVADKTQKPINELRFISIKEVE